jgi:hypothetical protein
VDDDLVIYVREDVRTAGTTDGRPCCHGAPHTHRALFFLACHKQQQLGRRESSPIITREVSSSAALFMMYFPSLIYTALLLFVVHAAAAAAVAARTSTTTLEGQLQFPDGTPFNVTTGITLNHGEMRTYSKIDGSFSFRDVPSGIHQIDVLSTVYHFGQVRIQLLEDSMDQPKCVEYMYPGAPKKTLDYPIAMTAYATFEYFETKPGFSIFVILKNPMFLMMAVSAGLMFLMPKMMEGMDEEEKAKMREQMAAQQDPTKMMSNLFSGFTGGTEESPAAAPKRKLKK